MLKFGEIINITIAIAHLVGLFWAEKMFEVIGIGNEMKQLAEMHTSLPYLLTFFVTIVFFIFGIYGLSAAEKFKKLPYLKIGIFTIASIYILCGIGELSFHFINNISRNSETLQSIIALCIGLLFLFGGLKMVLNKIFILLIFNIINKLI